MKKINILETTLRDGSYAIDFKFTASDTALIALELEKVGFEFIEIGHGVGLHASESGRGKAAETDETYLQAAARVLTRAKFGMFCIPGVARLEDIDMAAEYGMGFIRIGTNVTEMEDSEEYISRAKKHGMFISANFMKSYAMPPAEFAQKALLTQKFGADILCIVDSAGGMLASDVESYFRAVQSVCDIPLAFHGHNNLGLAISNTLHAVDLGAVIIDSSLQGLGRSAGNAATELLVAILQRKGIDVQIDLLKLMDIGEKYIKPLIRRRGLGSLDVVSGYSLFHSSYMGIIRQYASKFQVDPRRLIMKLCEIDKVNAPPELVKQVAESIAKESEEVFTARYEFDEYYGDEQSNIT